MYNNTENYTIIFSIRVMAHKKQEHVNKSANH